MVEVTIEIKSYPGRYMYVRYGQCVESIEATNKPLPRHLSHITPYSYIGATSAHVIEKEIFVG